MKEKESPKEGSRGVVVALVAVSVICALAVGFIVGQKMGGGGSRTPQESGPVKVILGDGSTLGGRLNKLESAVQAMVEETKQSVNEGRLMDLTALPTRFLDLSNAGGFPSKGPANATVVLVEFSDFQCPYCSRMARLMHELLAKYPQVRLIFVDRPLLSQMKDGFPFHPYAFTAHEAGQEALAQGKFWEMYSYIFEHQAELFPEGRPSSPQDYEEKLAKLRQNLVEIAGKLGMDSAKMKQALETHIHKSRIEKSLGIAEKLEIYSTPTVYVNSFFAFRSPDAFIKLMNAQVKLE